MFSRERLAISSMEPARPMRNVDSLEGIYAVAYLLASACIA